MKTKTYPIAMDIAHSALETAHASQGQRCRVYCTQAHYTEYEDSSSWYFSYTVAHEEANGFQRLLGISKGTIRVVVKHNGLADGGTFIARAA